MSLLTTLAAAAMLSLEPCSIQAVEERGADGLRLLTCRNGLSAVVDARPGTHTVAIRIGVRVGSRDEPADRAGISHLLEHLLFKEGHGETPRRNPAFSGLREAGGLVNATTDFELTEYYADLPADRFAEGWDALVSLVTATAFDAGDVAREREVVLQEVALGKTDPLAIVAYSVLRRVFPDDALGKPVIGFKSTLRDVTPDDLLDHYRRHYAPAGMFAVVVGDVDPEEASRRVAATVGSLPSSGPGHPGYGVPAPHREPVFRFRTLVSQSYLLMAALTEGIGSPDAASFELLAAILGQGRTSRLHRRLVDREAMTDQILALSFLVSNTGAFGAGVAVDPSRAEEARTALREEMDSLAREEVSSDELEVARARLLADLARRFETNTGIAEFRSLRLLHRQPISRDAWESRIARPGPGDLREAASRAWGGEGPTAIEVLPARGFGKVIAGLKYLIFRRL